jgi:beta-galactosidase/beta-glucuronidase
MKYYLASILFFINVCISVAQDSRAIDFNMGWKFFKGDGTGFEKSSYNDSEWKTVLLPHDWSVEGPFSNQWASATGYLPAGIGWYRKSFEVYEKDLSEITYIYFDGVYKNSEVWINDHYLGKRPNGFIPFYYDLSPHLKKGKNVIVVKADHADYADSRWYTGSGIYRNVYLLQLQPVHIGIWGQRFVTPEV